VDVEHGPNKRNDILSISSTEIKEAEIRRDGGQY